MTIKRLKAVLLFCLSAIYHTAVPAQSGSSSLASTSGRSLYFISDTQQPMTLEKLRLRPNHNIRATSLLLADMLRQKPLAIYMLGDVVALGSSDHKWRNVDRFMDSCKKSNIAVHGLMGNHDVMWSRKKGEKNFQKRFLDNVNIGYISITDSIAIIMLNSNFSKLSAIEISNQLQWYKKALKNLNSDASIKTIIVSCHHAPYSNSLIVGSSTQVQRSFLPDFIQSIKCSLFITGHAHSFEHFKFSGKDFLVIGGGGGLHQPLDTSAKRIPDISSSYKPMFHYLSIQRIGDKFLLTSHYLKPDFSGIEEGYSFEIKL